MINILSREQMEKRSFTDIKNGNNLGYFYAVQLTPESNPNRIKLGFTTSLKNRLNAYSTANPNAKYIDYVQCRKYWEKTLIDIITLRIPCTQVGLEVFDFDNLNQFLFKLDNLFSEILNDYNKEDYIYA